MQLEHPMYPLQEIIMVIEKKITTATNYRDILGLLPTLNELLKIANKRKASPAQLAALRNELSASQIQDPALDTRRASLLHYRALVGQIHALTDIETSPEDDERNNIWHYLLVGVNPMAIFTALAPLARPFNLLELDEDIAPIHEACSALWEITNNYSFLHPILAIQLLQPNSAATLQILSNLNMALDIMFRNGYIDPPLRMTGAFRIFDARLEEIESILTSSPGESKPLLFVVMALKLMDNTLQPLVRLNYEFLITNLLNQAYSMTRHQDPTQQLLTYVISLSIANGMWQPTPERLNRLCTSAAFRLLSSMSVILDQGNSSKVGEAIPGMLDYFMLRLVNSNKLTEYGPNLRGVLYGLYLKRSLLPVDVFARHCYNPVTWGLVTAHPVIFQQAPTTTGVRTVMVTPIVADHKRARPGV